MKDFTTENTENTEKKMKKECNSIYVSHAVIQSTILPFSFFFSVFRVFRGEML